MKRLSPLPSCPHHPGFLAGEQCILCQMPEAQKVRDAAKARGMKAANIFEQRAIGQRWKDKPGGAKED